MFRVDGLAGSVDVALLLCSGIFLGGVILFGMTEKNGGFMGVIQASYWDNGKEHDTYYLGFRV